MAITAVLEDSSRPAAADDRSTAADQSVWVALNIASRSGLSAD
jgi:hypothetical protein